MGIFENNYREMLRLSWSIFIHFFNNKAANKWGIYDAEMYIKETS